MSIVCIGMFPIEFKKQTSQMHFGIPLGFYWHHI